MIAFIYVLKLYWYKYYKVPSVISQDPRELEICKNIIENFCSQNNYERVFLTLQKLS